MSSWSTSHIPLPWWKHIPLLSTILLWYTGVVILFLRNWSNPLALLLIIESLLLMVAVAGASMLLTSNLLLGPLILLLILAVSLSSASLSLLLMVTRCLTLSSALSSSLLW